MSSALETGSTVEPVPMGRRERKKHELRERIVDAAAGLIAQQGLCNTTVDHIAEACDIAQATFSTTSPPRESYSTRSSAG